MFLLKINTNNKTDCTAKCDGAKYYSFTITKFKI